MPISYPWIFDPKHVDDLFWLQTGFLGDVVLTTAALHLAKCQFPNKKQWVITTPIGAKALKQSPDIDGIIVWNKRGGLLNTGFAEVRKQVFQKMNSLSRAVLLCAHKSPRSALLSRYLGLRTIGYQESMGHFLYHCRMPRVAVFHEAHRIALLLEALGVSRAEILSARPYLLAGPEPKESWFNDFQSRRKKIGFAPGSVWGTKRWLPESYAALINQLFDEDPELHVVLLGAENEVDVAGRVHSKVRATDRILNLAGKTKIELLPWVFSQLQLLVANDSAPIHFASALNIPTIAIFGSTIPEMGFGPLADDSIVMGLDELDCRPCSDHGPQRCPLGHFRCMRDLGVEQVLPLVRQRLAAVID